MKFVLKLSTYIILLFGVFSCASEKRVMLNLAPGIDFPVEEVNTRVNLREIPGITDVKIRDGQDLDLVNIGHVPVGFAADFGVRIFLANGNKWEQLTNNFGYVDRMYIIPPEADDPLGDAIVSVNPVIDKAEPPVKVRVIVIGTVYQNEKPTATLTAAYIDLILQP